MGKQTKYLLAYAGILGLTTILAVDLAEGKEVQQVISVEAVSDETGFDHPQVELDQAELDQMLAPIALYPDSVLSHILVASTYPLEVVQAARWREDNSDLSEQQALDAVEDEDWDPSVKALVPFNQLLQQLSDDLNWLQDLGDAFLANESQVLSSVQALRHKAYAQGSLQDSEYIEVVEQDDDIIIRPTRTEIIYIPYYDTREVYGNWHWANYPPRYWHRPAHYYWHSGFYWSPRVYVRNSIFFGGFQWHNRHVVVRHHYPRGHHRYDDGVRRVRSTEFQRWQHDPNHRRGVRYSQNTSKTIYQHNNGRPVKVTSNREGYAAQDRSVRIKRNLQRSQDDYDRTQRKLNRQTTATHKQGIRRVEDVPQRSHQQARNEQRLATPRVVQTHRSQEPRVNSRPIVRENRQATQPHRQQNIRTAPAPRPRVQSQPRTQPKVRMSQPAPRRSASNIRNTTPMQKQK